MPPDVGDQSLEYEPPQYRDALSSPTSKTLDRASSQYTLRSIFFANETTPRPAQAPSPTEHTRLFGPLSRPGPAYGLNTPTDIEGGEGEVNAPGLKGFRARRPLLVAALQMAGIFIVAAVLMGGTLWLALPTLDE